MKLFGFEFRKIEDELEREDKPLIRSFVNPENEDGAKDYYSNSLGGAYAYSLDLDKSITNQAALINEYRGTAMIPQVDMAIEDITVEAIVVDDGNQPLRLVLDDTTISDTTKKIIEEEFSNVLNLLKFPQRAHDIFKRGYIDGQLNYHKLVDEKNPQAGIQELRYIDPRNLVKVREHKKPDSDIGINFLSLKSEDYIEYWIYNDSGFAQTPTTVGSQTSLSGTKIAKDSIAHVNSGNIDPNSKLILGHLHKAVRVARQLRMLEDSMIIYTVSRCSDKRIFSVDISNIPKARAEQYMQSVIAKYKNKIVYDSNTGDVRSERAHRSITEDFWIPKNGNDGTSITTLEGLKNTSLKETTEYFKNNLYQSLNVPVSRLDPETMYVIGKSSETSRDEVKYSRFIDRLRNRFTILFDDLLSTQLKLKGIVNQDEWEEIQKYLKYEFSRDNHFSELIQGELNLNRVELLVQFDEFEGKYFSKDWIYKNILKLDLDDIEEIQEQIQEEAILQNEILLADHKMKKKMGLVKNDPETGEAIPQFHTESIEDENLDNLVTLLTEETKERIDRVKNLDQS